MMKEIINIHAHFSTIFQITQCNNGGESLCKTFTTDICMCMYYAILVDCSTTEKLTKPPDSPLEKLQ